VPRYSSFGLRDSLGLGDSRDRENHRLSISFNLKRYRIAGLLCVQDACEVGNPADPVTVGLKENVSRLNARRFGWCPLADALNTGRPGFEEQASPNVREWYVSEPLKIRRALDIGLSCPGSGSRAREAPSPRTGGAPLNLPFVIDPQTRGIRHTTHKQKRRADGPDDVSGLASHGYCPLEARL
jgi:hypothetical protein